MQDSKIIGLLKNLDAKEFRLFHKYLRSPFFNYSAAIISLYENLRKYYPDFDHPALDRQKVFKKVFPKEEYQDKKMRNLLHEMYAHVENFIVQIHLKEETFTQKKLLTAALAKRGQYDLFLKKNRDLIRAVKARPYRDIQTYQDLLDLEEEFYFHPVTNKIQDGQDSLKGMLEYLDAFFITKKLRIANELAAIEKITQQKVPLRMMEVVLAELEKEANSSNVLFSIYHLLYQLQNQGEKERFFELKQMLFEHFGRLNFSDQQNVLIQLLNFAIRSGNQGDQSFLTESFELYWFGLEKRLLLEKGKLTDSTFTNIVFGGCKIGALDKVEAFIRDYADFLEDSVREDAEKLALAYLSYNRKQYERVDLLIGQVQFRKIFYQIRSRGIQVRALFELFKNDHSFYEPLVYRIEAFEKFLRRNQSINGFQKRLHLNFLKYLKKITQYAANINVTGTEKEKLKKEIADQADVINKDWLIEQVDEKV